MRKGGSALFLRILSVFVFAFSVHDAHSTESGFDESAVEKWKESEITLPGFPNERDLLPVPLSPADDLRLFIDSTSLSRAADGVIRFSLVAQSAAGARNIFYEGIRCETREYKTYAVGAVDGTFSPIESPAWRPIPKYEKNAFRLTLYKHFVCDEHSTANTPAEIIRIIRYPEYRE